MKKYTKVLSIAIASLMTVSTASFASNGYLDPYEEQLKEVINFSIGTAWQAAAPVVQPAPRPAPRVQPAYIDDEQALAEAIALSLQVHGADRHERHAVDDDAAMALALQLQEMGGRQFEGNNNNNYVPARPVPAAPVNRPIAPVKAAPKKASVAPVTPAKAAPKQAAVVPVVPAKAAPKKASVAPVVPAKAAPKKAAAAAVAPPRPGAVNPEQATVAVQPVEAEIIRLTNLARQAAGLPALTFNAQLTQAARSHSANMARQVSLAHELDGQGPMHRVTHVGYPWQFLAENIGCRWPASAENMVRAWLESPGHRANIMSANFNEIGIGVGLATDSHGTTYYTQVFGRRL